MEREHLQNFDVSCGHAPGSAGVSPASCWAESRNAPARGRRSQGGFKESAFALFANSLSNCSELPSM